MSVEGLSCTTRGAASKISLPGTSATKRRSPAAASARNVTLNGAVGLFVRFVIFTGARGLVTSYTSMFDEVNPVTVISINPSAVPLPNASMLFTAR